MSLDEQRARLFHKLWGKGAKLGAQFSGRAVHLEEIGVNVWFYFGGHVEISANSRCAWGPLEEFLDEQDKVLFLIRKVVTELPKSTACPEVPSAPVSKSGGMEV